jgi:hypothetical protein
MTVYQDAPAAQYFCMSNKSMLNKRKAFSMRECMEVTQNSWLSGQTNPRQGLTGTSAQFPMSNQGSMLYAWALIYNAICQFKFHALKKALTHPRHPSIRF